MDYQFEPKPTNYPPSTDFKEAVKSVLNEIDLVESLVAGTNITLSPTDGEGVVTINAVVPVTSLVAGTNITLDPATGVGNVTINADGAVKSIVAGTNITVSGPTGDVTINSTASLKMTSGTVTYTSADNNVQKTITTTDNATGVTFQPKLVTAYGFFLNVQSQGFASFNGLNVEQEDNINIGGTRSNGWILSFTTGTPGVGLDMDAAITTGFKWTVKHSSTGNVNVFWVAIG